MYQISTRGRYGLRAMLELARRYEEGPVSLQEIAEDQGVSFKYLEQIFAQLKSEGLVQSVRGAEGGYMLHKPPREISVKDIVLALEGRIAPAECLEEGTNCGREEECISRRVWRELQTTIEKLLSRKTLSGLLEESNRLDEVKDVS